MHLLPRSLNYVDTVARLGSIQAASRALGIAASAIDRQILALEQDGKTLLFERQPKGMRLTAAGEAVVLLARRWRADAERLAAGLTEMQGLEVGTVRLAAMDSQVNGVLPDLVAKLERRHPSIRLAVEILSPEGALHALDEGAADVALAFNLRPHNFLHVLWSEQLPFGCVVGPGHPLAAMSEITLREAARHPLAAQSRLLPVREYLDRKHGWLFSSVEPTLVTNSLQLLKQVLRQGRLMTITSRLDVASEVQAGELIFIPLRDRSLVPQSISVAINARRSLPRIARLVAKLLADLTAARLSSPRDIPDVPTEAD